MDHSRGQVRRLVTEACIVHAHHVLNYAELVSNAFSHVAAYYSHQVVRFRGQTIACICLVLALA